MIRMIQSQTSLQAKEYFDAALQASDYYLEDQELEGRIMGKVAQRLGLNDTVATRQVFHALCDNINPTTGKQLTPRTQENRTVGYDINFHCPKSVSLLHVFSKDTRVLESFEASVRQTMKLIEADMKTRVRRGGKNENRDTHELIYASFVHQTARPVSGALPDAHLHAHVFTFNTTYDPIEERFKAAQFRDIKRDMPYYQAYFHKVLADKISELDYSVTKTRSAFEVAEINKQATRLFSKRTDEIGRFATEKGITDPEELAELGARTRSKKLKGQSMSELTTNWQSQLEQQGIELLTDDTPTPQPLSIKECVDHAIDHSFERASVSPERRILATAYHQAVDQGHIKPEALDTRYKNDDRLFKVDDGYQTLVTTQKVQWEERRMVGLAREGRGQLNPLYTMKSDVQFEGLNAEQSQAVRHVLCSPDRYVFIRGGAGTGKTTLTKTAVAHLEEKGKQVFLFAPTAESSRGVLRAEGFEDADTVHSLLSSKEIQALTKDQVIWVDEAGLLGTRDMADLFEIAKEQNARVVLSGDTRQHTAVKRGDALRILQKLGGLSPATVNRIYRQRTADYREAVDLISRGEMDKAFAKLDGMKAIKEAKQPDLINRLSDDYLSSRLENKSALVISPTNDQAREVTSAIRDKLKRSEMIGKRDKDYTTLRNLYFTEAEKSDARNFEAGQVLQFNQNIKGVKRGEKCTVAQVSSGQVIFKTDTGQAYTLDLTKPDKFDVYKSETTPLTRNDLITVTRNGFDRLDHRLNNGTQLAITGFEKDGTIKAQVVGGHGKTIYIEPSFGNFRHAYCSTSYAAQGKTVDRVLIAQPADTFPATSQKQFYVSVSRGREEATIYTDSKEDLLEHASRHGERMSALELESQVYPARLASLRKDFDQEKIITRKGSNIEPDI
ncbi:MAG: MobF family relaxase [Cyclobacteriaceae bacterium]